MPCPIILRLRYAKPGTRHIVPHVLYAMSGTGVGLSNAMSGTTLGLSYDFAMHCPVLTYPVLLPESTTAS
eukprot:1936434-Rhodomonas_salina.3